MKRSPRTALFMGALLILGFCLRTFHLNWDQGYHMHPDERAIVMATVKLSYPSSLSEFLSPQSPWNTHFFAYGSLPFYLLKISGDALQELNPLFAQYAEINLVGRVLSALFDTGTILLVFLLGRRLRDEKTGLLSALLYTLAVLPIQLSHFYAVDTLLTFFCLLTLYLLILFYEAPTLLKALFIGISLGCALATKISATVLFSAVGISLTADFLLVFFKNVHRPSHWIPQVFPFVKKLSADLGLISLSCLITYALLEPYAFLDFSEFWQQTLQQSAMTKSAFTFPYTLQYVGKVPYWYELKNIFLWGMGPVLATVCFAGIIFLVWHTLQKDKQTRWAREFILLAFMLSYFAVVGKFAVGFMRYMLPLYPLFCLCGGLLLVKVVPRLHTSPQQRIVKRSVLAFILLACAIWPLSFLSIYTRDNTRVQATNWILTHIPAGKTLAIEHWDDALPLIGQERYTMLTLPLYDPDTPEKWESISQQLTQTNYLILASNRLYTPLQKLTDCQHLPPERCYPITAAYYADLFAGRRGFHKVAEFSSYPTIPLLNIPLPDQSADESFTVYDHPKVIIFQHDTNP